MADANLASEVIYKQKVENVQNNIVEAFKNLIIKTKTIWKRKH
jgi:hypothetical protein